MHEPLIASPLEGAKAGEETEADTVHDTPVARVVEPHSGDWVGWRGTLAWAGWITCWYAILQTTLPWMVRSDPAAEALLSSQVPRGVYMYSEAAFFTATVLNLLSFVFEETPEKRQLALLSALIKGLSWHCDHLIVTGHAVITFDGYGALLLPSRYAQWSCTTPTMLFTLSKITDFTAERVALVMFADWVMILTGYLAAVYPPGFASFFFLTVSFATFYFVLYSLYGMIHSALSEANTRHAKISLHFTLWSSFVIWHLFPTAWCAARLGPSVAFLQEPLLMFCNFGAKVVFSSCILYNNYVTLQQRRIAAQLEQEHKDRIRMVAELKTAVQSKDEFISVIGHELRTPLNAVIQLSSAIMANFGAPGTWQKHYVWMETITRSAQHLMGIINDIITVRAARSGIMHLKQELVHIGHVVDHVVRTLSPMAKRGVVVEKAVAGALPPMVADERRIIQLLSNLLGNALKFTDRGKVTVMVRVDRGGRHVIIKVQDTGCGIPKTELKNLLVPFKQVDMSSKRKYGGAGLGLSISNQLVEAHAGSLTLESCEGEGTLVVVKLPVLQPETLPALEEPFRAAYASVGYSFEELMNPEVAKAEHRRAPTFRSSMDQRPPSMSSSRTSRSSIDSVSGNLKVERFCWDDYYDSPGGADVALSAAASGLAGPPPMAVALVSSLYSSSAPVPPPPVPQPAAACGAAAAAAPNVHMLNSLPPVAAPPAVSQWATVPMSHSNHGPKSGGDNHPASHNNATASAPANVVGAAAPGLLPTEERVEDEGAGEGEQEPDEWAGTWHRAPRFGDDHDKDKGYYAYDNRLSYDYRPSLDQGNNSGDWVKKILSKSRAEHDSAHTGTAGGQVLKSPTAGVTSVFRRISLSINSSLRNSADNASQRASHDNNNGGGAGAGAAGLGTALSGGQLVPSASVGYAAGSLRSSASQAPGSLRSSAGDPKLPASVAGLKGKLSAPTSDAGDSGWFATGARRPL